MTDKNRVRSIGKGILFRIISIVIVYLMSAIVFIIGRNILTSLQKYFKDVNSIDSYYNIAAGWLVIFTIIFSILSYRRIVNIFLKDDKILNNEGGYSRNIRSFFDKYRKNKIVKNLKTPFYLLVIILMMVLAYSDLFVIS